MGHKYVFSSRKTDIDNTNISFGKKRQKSTNSWKVQQQYFANTNKEAKEELLMTEELENVDQRFKKDLLCDRMVRE